MNYERGLRLRRGGDLQGTEFGHRRRGVHPVPVRDPDTPRVTTRPRRPCVAQFRGPVYFGVSCALCLGMSQLVSHTRSRGAHNPTSWRREADELVRPGSGTFRYSYGDGWGGVTSLDVRFHRPARFGSDSPILFVMHGTKRNAADYRNTWVPVAERHGCLLVCPEFPRANFRHGAYQFGAIVDAAGASRPRAAWTFEVVERLFDLVRDATGNASAGYYIYGHSAGGQFVHRLTLFLPEARYIAAAAANAGWYTMPTFREDFPYGLAGTSGSAEALGTALTRRLIVLVGAEDVAADDPHLRNSRRARRQGENRRERGYAFHAAARAEAHRLGVKPAWELVTVPGAAHSDAEMMPAAAAALFSIGVAARAR